MIEKLNYAWLNFWMKFFGGHITIGSITIFGANAMNWTINIRTKKWGVICFTLPTISRFRKTRYDKKWRFEWYYYLSPNGTPWASTYYIGTDKKEHIRAQVRQYKFGHNFDAWNDDEIKKKLWQINDLL